MFDAMEKAKYDFDEMFNYIDDKVGKKILENLGEKRVEALTNKMLDNNSAELLPDVILAYGSPTIARLLIEEKIESSDYVDLEYLTSKQVNMIIENPEWFIKICKKHRCNISPELAERVFRF